MITIHHSASVRNTPAFALIVEGWNEIVQDGRTPDDVALPLYNVDSSVLYAIGAEGEPLAVIVYGKEPVGFRIQLAYVEPSSRSTGLYKKLRAELYKRANGAPVTLQKAA